MARADRGCGGAFKKISDSNFTRNCSNFNLFPNHANFDAERGFGVSGIADDSHVRKSHGNMLDVSSILGCYFLSNPFQRLVTSIRQQLNDNINRLSAL